MHKQREVDHTPFGRVARLDYHANEDRCGNNKHQGPSLFAIRILFCKQILPESICSNKQKYLPAKLGGSKVFFSFKFPVIFNSYATIFVHRQDLANFEGIRTYTKTFNLAHSVELLWESCSS